MLFFSTWQDLRLPNWGGGEIAYLDFKNIDPFVGLVINEGKATLKELQESYNLEDLYKLVECILVQKANEYYAHKDAEKKASKT